MGDLSEAQQLYSTLARQEYNLGVPALTGASKYLQGEYSIGGYDQSDKYSALSTDVLEKSMLGGGDVSSRGQATAIGESSIATQKIMSGVDEINKVRSMLGSQGLKTTALGVEAAQTGVQALSQVPRGTTMSEILAGAGAASAIYGAYSGAQGKQTSVSPGAFSTQSTAPVGSQQYYESGQSLNLQGPGYGGSSYFSKPFGGG